MEPRWGSSAIITQKGAVKAKPRMDKDVVRSEENVITRAVCKATAF